jgi:hypothetical protein
MPHPDLDEDIQYVDDETRHLIDSKKPFGDWSREEFLRFVNTRSVSEWGEWVIRYAHPSARGFSLLKWHQLKAIANHAPVLMDVGPERPENARRRKVLLKRAARHQGVLDAVRRLRQLHDEVTSTDPFNAERVVFAEAFKLTETIEVDGLSRFGLAWYLTMAATESPIDSPDWFREEEWGVALMPKGTPNVWVNLNRSVVSLDLLPGAVVVDVTARSEEDLKGPVWDAIDEANRVLGQPKGGGGRHGDDEINAFISSLYDHRTPKGKALTLRQKTIRVNRRFGLELSEAAVDKRYRYHRNDRSTKPNGQLPLEETVPTN